MQFSIAKNEQFSVAIDSKYRCIGTCSATAGSGGAISLTGDWDFIHASGATTSRPDANYLFFGWWLQKDKDDDPTSAGAFTGVVGAANAPTANPNAITGSATYAGHAAGKFAINSPLGGSDAGHFTADATLTAKFGAGATTPGASGTGISGTLENFMANGQAVPWSVSLFRRAWDSANIGVTLPFNDPDTSSVDESVTQTVWSIDGNSAAASGTWTAQMYDEAQTGSADDGSNVPTTVTGTFHSDFGSTHTMVGAYGATKE